MVDNLTFADCPQKPLRIPHLLRQWNSVGISSWSDAASRPSVHHRDSNSTAGLVVIWIRPFVFDIFLKLPNVGRVQDNVAFVFPKDGAVLSDASIVKATRYEHIIVQLSIQLRHILALMFDRQLMNCVSSRAGHVHGD